MSSYSHLINSTPAQFSAFQGVRMYVPGCHLRRGRPLMPGKRQVVSMSFMGVGAPEAVLVAVVALVVFGPKGLADAAKSAGKAFKSIQPTLKEVVEVSRDLQGTIQEELGLDELNDTMRRPTRTSTAGALMDDPDIEAKRREAAKMAWGDQAAATPAAAMPQTLNSSPAPAVPATPAPAAGAARDLSTLSMAELEAELAKRKAQDDKM